MKLFRVFYTIRQGTKILTMGSSGTGSSVRSFSTRARAETLMDSLIKYCEAKNEPPIYVKIVDRVQTNRPVLMDLNIELEEIDIDLDSSEVDSELPGFKEFLVKNDLKGLLE